LRPLKVSKKLYTHVGGSTTRRGQIDEALTCGALPKHRRRTRKADVLGDTDVAHCDQRDIREFQDWWPGVTGVQAD